MKKVKRYIPEKINNFLLNNIHIHIKFNKDLSSTIHQLDYEGLVIICDTILRVGGTRDIDKNNYCEIQTECFHKILHNDYKLYLDYLIDSKIVLSDNFYIPGEKSIGYKLNEDYLNELNSIDISNKLWSKRTINSINTNEKFKISSKHKNNYLKTLKIDYDKAIEYLYHCYVNKIPDHKGRILNPYTKTLIEHKLMQINDGQLWINRSNTNGRINSNLTTLNGNFKQFLLGYDYSLDIVSSQPTLLNILFKLIKSLQGGGPTSSFLSTLLSYEYKMILKTLPKSDAIRFIDSLKSVKLPSEKEMNMYKDLCESGGLYEYFQSEIFVKMNKKLTRSEVKTIVMVVMYSSNHSSSEYKQIFSAVFPSIYNFLCKMKSLIKIKRSHRMLPLLLQGIESYVWVENILPELDRMNINYLFIHDSIIIREKDLERSELKILEQFYIANVNAKISIEKIKK